MDDAVELPMDAVVEILKRLPPSSRRRFRLVCRLWRDAVDGSTTEMRSRAKVLLWNACTHVAYVVDDLSPSSTGSCTELWSRPDGSRSDDLQLVATCNGLLCLCDNGKMPGGAITVVNPATGEAVAIPPLPCAGLFDGIHGPDWRACQMWHQTYTFAYHPVSGRYKVVHVPSMFKFDDDERESDALQVLTLGEASWREVPTGTTKGGVRCHRIAGIISVDGTTYWATEGSTARIVSFDLEQERVTSFPLPTRPKTPASYDLTEVHGRLGIVIRHEGLSMATDVWVLEKGRGWSRRYSFRCQYLPRTHFVHGEHVITVNESLYAQGPWLYSDVVRVGHQGQKTLVAKKKFGRAYYPNRTFAYVETMEPLSVYSINY